MTSRVKEIEDRVLSGAERIKATKCTVRQLAKYENVSKSTSHKDITDRLKILNYSLYLEVREILDQHKQERHIRGGEATKQKWKQVNRG